MTTDAKIEAPQLVATGDLFGVWVPVADRLPKTGRRVLVTALNGIHVWRTVAQYWPGRTMGARRASLAEHASEPRPLGTNIKTP